jgi:hypothetical protein
MLEKLGHGIQDDTPSPVSSTGLGARVGKPTIGAIRMRGGSLLSMIQEFDNEVATMAKACVRGSDGKYR